MIIEYKKNKNFSIIDQGYAYLALMLNNKADFILEYNELKKDILKKREIDWSQSKVMFIAPSFTTYQREAINFKDLPIELWEVKKYSNATISYSRIRPTRSTESIKMVSQGDTAIEHVSQEVHVYSKETLLTFCSSSIQEAYDAIQDEVYQLDNTIEEKVTKTMICYYSGGKGLVWIALHKHKLRLHLRKGTYRDTREKIKLEGWGGYPELTFSETDVDIVYIKDLLQQAYNM